MSFQSDKPMIHKIYYQQLNLVNKFYSHFVKPGVLAKCKKGKQFLNLDLSEKNILPKKLLFIGTKAKKLVEKLGHENPVVVKFLDSVKKAYVECGTCKRSCHWKTILKAFTAIDPLIVTNPNALVLERLLCLPSIVLSVLDDDEEETYEKEVWTLLVDSTLPPAMCEMQEVDCVKWWISVKEHYPLMFKMATGILSIFRGPRVVM